MLSTRHGLVYPRFFLMILFRGILDCFEVSAIILNCRDVLELTEAIKIKDGEAEAYISEIEVPHFVFVALCFLIFQFIPAHDCFPPPQSLGLTSKLLSCRLLVKHTKICRHRISIYYSR